MRRLVPPLAALLLAAATPAAAEEAAPRRLADAELAAARAGLMTPLGIEVGFAASVQTFVDGRLVLESWVAWSETGLTTRTAGADGTPLPAGTPFFDAPAAGGGTTQVLHHIGEDRIASVVLNTANDRAIRQVTDIMLSVPELQQFQRQVAVERTALNLDAAVSAALRDGTQR
ncbi:hypothetical protein [Phenylobacterium sp.]|uniref:hypothetical protein n=1 Tax=Phenylobacterium sp. TaxID=1871053 RepID=UPI0035B3F50C